MLGQGIPKEVRIKNIALSISHEIRSGNNNTYQQWPPCPPDTLNFEGNCNLKEQQSYKNSTLKISYSSSLELFSYLPVKFVFFLKSRLFFNTLYCYCMFVNKHCTYLGLVFLKK